MIMRPVRDLTGQRSGRLVALEPTQERVRRSVVWKCRCDCGNCTHVSAGDWGKVRSCGCLGMENIAGQRFGRLIATEPSDVRSGGSVVWKCKCDCGNQHLATVGQLRSGNTTSCGCYQSQICSSIENGGDGTSERGKCIRIKNILNGKLSKANKSGVTGVCFVRRINRWKVYIRVNYKRIHLGYYSKFEDAVKVRKSAEWMLEERIEHLEEKLSKLKDGDPIGR